jgi:hypothetical protein
MCMCTLLRLTSAIFVLTAASSAYALAPVGCSADAKLCPDGVTYVGRDGNNNCEWQKCPGEGGVFTFGDVPLNHPHADAITYVKEQGIVEGYSDGTYKPDATINRAEFVKILVEAVAEENGPVCKIAPFSDVDQASWYATYAHKARCLGLVEGYSDGSFQPSNFINFVEAAKILVKAYGLEATTTIDSCDDPTDIECTWYRPYVLMLEAHASIPTSIKRYEQLITRGEMAEMIYRLKTGTADRPSQDYSSLERRAHCDRMKAMGYGCE